MATHNGEKYIREQIDSILMQISSSDELVISDDGSTDATLDIIKSYKDSRIKLFIYRHRQKYGYKIDYSTHNFENALKHAVGDLIFLADQDDVWLPNKVERVLENIAENDILLHGRKVVDANLNVLKEFAMPMPGFWRNIRSCSTTGCCTVLKRNVLQNVLPFPKSGVAHDFWIGVYGGLLFKRTFLNESLILFRRHGDNVTPSDSKSSMSISKRVLYRLITLWEVLKRLVIFFVR